MNSAQETTLMNGMISFKGKGIASLLAILSTICTATAEESKFIPIEQDLNSIRSSSAPAFTILDINPTSIERPLNPRDFSTSILSSVGDSESSLPGNLAIEFAPYWWTGRPDIEFDDLLHDSSLGDNFVRNLSFSLASSERKEGESASTDLAFGFRTTLLSGKPSKKLSESISVLQNGQLDIARIFASEACEAARESGLDTDEDPSCKKALSLVEAKFIKSVGEYRKLVDKRVGFQLDLAAATSYRFPDNSTSERERFKTGAWITASYTPDSGETGGLQFIGLARFISENTDSDDSNDNVDAGLRLLWQSNKQPLAVSVEYLSRRVDEGNNTERYAGILEYQINPGLNFVASFGKNFRPENSSEDLFVVGGINFNFGSKPTILIPSLQRPKS